MLTDFPLFPESASTMAPRVDGLYFFLVGLTVFFSLLIASLIVAFAIKYRRRTPDSVGVPVHGALALEVAWSVIPLGITLVIFAWGASVFFAMSSPPEEAINVYVVGKQWMWKFQHLNGQREVNELHVPVGRPVKLIMTSEDVIHDLFVPAFRVKADVLPGRYTHVWFEATKPGRYRLFCAEYCGTQHSGMGAQVVALGPPEYQDWLSAAAGGSMASAGQRLFADMACSTCHRKGEDGRGPVLNGLYGSTVRLRGGRSAVVDEAYLRESIVNPSSRLTEGFQPVMPAYQGLVTEEGLSELVEYIKSLEPAQPIALSMAPTPGGSERTAQNVEP